MVSVAVKSLWARRLRALGTTVAVFVGVSLIAGTYVLTDTINKAFDQIFSDSLKGTSVVITNEQPVTQQTNTSTSFPAGVLKKVEAVPGVKLAAGTIFTGGGIFNGDEEVGSQFSPKFISAVLPPQIETLKTVEGHRPTNNHEATLDKAAADDAGLSVGDPIRIAGERRVRTYRLVGLTELGGTSFGGASIAQLTLPEAQYISGNVGRFNQISVGINPDVSSDELKARIERVVPPTLRVETAEQNANRSSDEIHDALSFLPIFLGVFAAVALIVGAFVIFNTFSITVSQRIREYGLLRTLGASRRQVLALGVRRGRADRPGWRGPGCPRRAALREGHRVAVQRTRHRPADHRACGREPHRDRLGGARHRRHADSGAQPGPALDPGATDRGDAEPRADRQPPSLDRHRRDRLAADARRPCPGSGRAVRQPEDRGCGAAASAAAPRWCSSASRSTARGSSGRWPGPSARRSRGCAG